MTHRTPLTLTSKNIPGNLQSSDTMRLVSRSGLFADIGAASAYPKDLYISTDSQETYWSNGTSWVKVGAGILNYVSAVSGESGVISIGGTSNVPIISITTAGITNAKLANVATQTFKGRTTAATGVPEDLTVAQAKTMLSLTGANSGDLTVTSIGSTSNANGLTLAGQVLNLQPANASFGGIITTIAQTIAGEKTFNNTVTHADGADFSVGTTTGTKIGTSTAQKLGFWNVTPVVQPASANQVAVATTSSTNVAPYGFTTASQADSIITLLNEIRSALVSVGIIKGSA